MSGVAANWPGAILSGRYRASLCIHAADKRRGMPPHPSAHATLPYRPPADRNDSVTFRALSRNHQAFMA